MLDERNINERNPKTNWIDRVHVIRRGEDATRQLPSRFFKLENTCRTFQAAILISRICRKIRYESTILPLDSVYLCICVYICTRIRLYVRIHERRRETNMPVYTRSNRDIIEDIGDSFYNPACFRPSIFDRRCIHQGWLR